MIQKDGLVRKMLESQAKSKITAVANLFYLWDSVFQLFDVEAQDYFDSLMMNYFRLPSTKKGLLRILNPVMKILQLTLVRNVRLVVASAPYHGRKVLVGLIRINKSRQVAELVVPSSAIP